MMAHFGTFSWICFLVGIHHTAKALDIVVVDIAGWEVDETGIKRILDEHIPIGERPGVMEKRLFQDKKCKLVSRLLQRRLSRNAIHFHTKYNIGVDDDHADATTKIKKLQDAVKREVAESPCPMFSSVKEDLNTHINIQRTCGKKPYLNEPKLKNCNYNFNVSDEGDFVVGVSDMVGLIGVDVAVSDHKVFSKMKSCDDLKTDAQRMFTEKELEYVCPANISLEEAKIRYLRIWSLKEAILKARGEGVATGTKHIEFFIKERVDDEKPEAEAAEKNDINKYAQPLDIYVFIQQDCCTTGDFVAESNNDIPHSAGFVDQSHLWNFTMYQLPKQNYQRDYIVSIARGHSSQIQDDKKMGVKGISALHERFELKDMGDGNDDWGTILHNTRSDFRFQEIKAETLVTKPEVQADTTTPQVKADNSTVPASDARCEVTTPVFDPATGKYKTVYSDWAKELFNQNEL